MELLEINRKEIDRDPKQPRVEFDNIALEELAASIKEHGVLQPILVRRDTDSEKFIIIAGERRWLASAMAGLESVPALIADSRFLSEDTGRLDEASVLVLALSENMLREDLSNSDIAKALVRLRDEYGIPQRELAKRMGKSESTISKILMLERPENQLDLQVIRSSDSGAADALTRFRSLSRPLQEVLRQHNGRTGYTFSENDIKKIKKFEEGGGRVIESNVADILERTLPQLRDDARDFAVARKESVAVVEDLAPSPVPMSKPVVASDAVTTVIDTGGINFDNFFEDYTRAPDPDRFAALKTGPAMEIPPLNLAGIVLTGKQVRALLRILGANSEVPPMLAHDLLLKCLREIG